MLSSLQHKEDSMLATVKGCRVPVRCSQPFSSGRRRLQLRNISQSTKHQLGRLVSESAFERKDPGSNPAADMVDAARNTAWDLGDDAKIVGGTEAAPGEFPFVVALYLNNTEGEVNFHCGGSLISRHYVVTGAHCVSGWSAWRLKVVAGTVDLENPSTAMQEIFVDEVLAYELFHFEVGTAIPTNDVAVLRLHGDGAVGEDIGTIPMVAQDVALPIGKTCTIIGWGATEEGGSVVATLHKVDVVVQEQSSCFDSYGYQFRPTMLCAGFAEGGADACQGDSGGPLVCDGVLHGIMSWGKGCAEPLEYGVYTRLAVFADWVEKHNFVLGYPDDSSVEASASR
ncbi:Serine proteases trypsin domain [Trinorchestia longiramus]|nr:Serine proteases trypsin domain [Trinorchestia longiramus]